MKIGNHILFAGIALLALQSACNEKRATPQPSDIKVPIGSALGIGNKIESFRLPRRVIVLNPDSAKQVQIPPS